MRVFTASLATETNTFAPLPTGRASFEAGDYFPAGTHPDRPTLFSGPLWAARQRGRERGWTVIEGLVAAAQPAGTTTRATYEGLRDQILSELRAAMPVDMVLVGLHGAMVADGYHDCEGDLLSRIRAIVGPKVVVGAAHDPHCHLTSEMVGAADILVIWKEYPHTDAVERAFALVDLCERIHRGAIKPVPAVVDTGAILMIHTTRDPGQAIVAHMKDLERRNAILSVSLAHGFPWGDVPGIGTKALVYADGDKDAAEAAAADLAKLVNSHRETLAAPFPGIDDTLDQALKLEGPVVISDGADNAGGGAPSDSTFILRRLFERGLNNAAVGPLWDPVAVEIAFNAGPGAVLPMRIGGKICALSGEPLDRIWRVKSLVPDLIQTGMVEGTTVECGNAALIESDGVEVALVSIRGQVFCTDLFTNLGCDVARKHIVVVKSSQHFYAHFSKIAKHVLYCDAPGVVGKNLANFEFNNITYPRWPIAAPRG